MGAFHTSLRTDARANASLDHLRRLDATPLVITPEHALAAGPHPMHHVDPSDRMLVAHVRLEGVPIATNDVAIARYDVQTLW